MKFKKGDVVVRNRSVSLIDQSSRLFRIKGVVESFHENSKTYKVSWGKESTSGWYDTDVLLLVDYNPNTLMKEIL